MTLKCVIIDDEPLAVKVIQNYIEQIKELQEMAVFNNAIDSLAFLRENKPDLLFLDVNMPIIDGFSFLDSLDDKPMVIITSAHAEHAAKGFDQEVLDYLVKPISLPRFIKAVNKAITKTKDHPKWDAAREHIFVKVDKKKMKKIYLDEIILVESLKDYIKIITTKGNHIVHKTLSAFTDELSSDRFIRIHRSHTVSMDKIDALEGNSVEIAGKRYVIGRSYLDAVKSHILERSISTTGNKTNPE
ncbi:MAG: response regulator transcription factor [Allomuricauda sp.]|jgi:DNA-binding LytR/AlgR family response regulator|uniref:LytR/AlgR family response regulator transcription factor n=1 Tax=Allomuricauda sp. CP2A TaxID=1848189 RepID=UPI00082C7499|nr:response regulator transcription factor [Muricauda sp. CP2A]